jgi:ParB/RepB/Spo0J family partition protein
MSNRKDNTMTRNNKRTDDLRQRLSRQPDTIHEPPVEYPTADQSRTARAHFLGTPTLERLTLGRTVEQLPVTTIAPELHPDRRQPRRLPLPEELLSIDGWAKDEDILIRELIGLGNSLKQHQIHPIIVYPGTSETYPQASYLIAVGHRRWTAARIVGKQTLDAIIIEPPSPQELILLQYTENENRTEFSDVERAWALQRIKHHLGDVPWDVVEKRFGISEARRKQLMRLTVFTPEQQQHLAHIRAAETQIRPLHTALRDGSISADQGAKILNQLIDHAKNHSRTQTQNIPAATDTATDTTTENDTSAPVAPPAQSAPRITKAYVSRLVAQAKKPITHSDVSPPNPSPSWLMSLIQTLQRTHTAIQHAQPHLNYLDPATTQQLIAVLTPLTTDLSHIVDQLQHRQHTQDHHNKK